MYRNSMLFPQSAADISAESSMLRPDDVEKAGYVSVWAIDIRCEVIIAVGSDIWLSSLVLSKSYRVLTRSLSENTMSHSTIRTQTLFFLSIFLMAVLCSIAFLFFAISNSFLLMSRLYTTMRLMGRNFMMS